MSELNYLNQSHLTDDVRIKNIKELLPPVALLERYPISDNIAHLVHEERKAIHNILNKEDKRLLVIVGPCSIHDSKAALEYGEKLAVLRQKHKNNLNIIMRVYFEKPRTTVGWKGLINDPYLDNSFQINDGLRLARKLLLDLNSLGLPTASEYLDMISPQYIADLLSWGAIGARTTESQVHRELASGLSCPIGFKNGTDGNIKIAIDGIRAAAASHHFLSVTKFGHSAIVETEGNEDCHIILRGGKTPNYSALHIQSVCEQLEAAALPQTIMVDCSHANSDKKFKKQIAVCDDLCEQIVNGQDAITGVMIESHLKEGRQDLVDGKAPVYGKSITDACLSWDDTEGVIDKLAAAVASRM